ncbi:MAG: hypothetical protein AB7O62_12840 [Pirellulales bacterium]
MALLAAGCNSSQPGTPGASANSDGLPPETVVSNFLESVRTGDDEGAATMLTHLAREMAEEHDMVIAPPGSTTASYTVGETEILETNDIAHVQSTWNDEGEEHEIIWALRSTDEGWRIAGMATKVFEDLNPVLLNFEDPEDMFQQQHAVEQEMYRRTQQSDPNAPADNLDEVPGEEVAEGVDGGATEDSSLEDRRAALPKNEEETPAKKGSVRKR